MNKDIFKTYPRSFRRGIEILERGKTDKGIKRIEKSVESGFKQGMVFLDIFQHSSSVNQAIELFLAEYQHDFVKSALEIGIKYYEGKDRIQSFSESVRFFLESARAGGIEACNYIGSMREKGEGLPLDMKKAFEWYERGAERGDKVAKYNYGCLLYSGEGGYKDTNEAVDYWYASAKEGYLPAIYKVGEIFELGLTVPVKLHRRNMNLPFKKLVFSYMKARVSKRTLNKALLGSQGLREM
jgi:TPR repeat protein